MSAEPEKMTMCEWMAWLAIFALSNGLASLTVFPLRFVFQIVFMICCLRLVLHEKKNQQRRRP